MSSAPRPAAEPPHPRADPAALNAAAEALQAAAARLLAIGAPLEDITALAETVRVYVAEHAAATVDRLNRSIGVLSPSPLSTKPIDAVRTVDLPLTERPTPPQDRCLRPGCDHPNSWHAMEYGCMAGKCPCPAFRPWPPCAECGHPKPKHSDGRCVLCGILRMGNPRHAYSAPQED